MKYEGHFLLWYLILMPFAKLGFPYITTNIISWSITCISVWLILKKAPFKTYKKVLLIFTFPLIYLYPVISRCYCLIPLAVVVMCIFYKTRKEKPFRYLISILFLANTHVIMLGMVGIVLLDFFIEMIKEWKNKNKKENKKILISFISSIILLFISALPLFGCLTLNKDIGTSTESFIIKIIFAIVYYPICIVAQNYNNFLGNIIIAYIIFLAIAIILFCEIKENLLDYIKIFLSIFYQCIIYAFIYCYSDQRVATIIFIVLYFKWININKQKEKNISKICWIILVIINIIIGLCSIIYDVKNNYSNAYEMGNFINENIEKDSIILSGQRMEFISSIIPFVENKNIKFYQIIGNRYFSYAILDDDNKKEIQLEDIKKVLNNFDETKKIYLIYCINKSNLIESENEENTIKESIEKEILKEIYSTDKNSYTLEDYVIYEVNL